MVTFIIRSGKRNTGQIQALTSKKSGLVKWLYSYNVDLAAFT